MSSNIDDDDVQRRRPLASPARSFGYSDDGNTILRNRRIPGILLPHQIFQSRLPNPTRRILLLPHQIFHSRLPDATRRILLPHQIFRPHFPRAASDDDNDEVDSSLSPDDASSPDTTQSDGLSKEIISQFLKSRSCTRRPGGGRRRKDLEEICVVCQRGYEREEMVAALECGHEYHKSCIHRWLTLKNSCPLCNREAIDIEWSL